MTTKFNTEQIEQAKKLLQQMDYQPSEYPIAQLALEAVEDNIRMVSLEEYLTFLDMVDNEARAQDLILEEMEKDSGPLPGSLDDLPSWVESAIPGTLYENNLLAYPRSD
jgi:hypothetical protein